MRLGGPEHARSTTLHKKRPSATHLTCHGEGVRLGKHARLVFPHPKKVKLLAILCRIQLRDWLVMSNYRMVENNIDPYYHDFMSSRKKGRERLAWEGSRTRNMEFGAASCSSLL